MEPSILLADMNTIKVFGSVRIRRMEV
jgi:hypothetical protein